MSLSSSRWKYLKTITNFIRIVQYDSNMSEQAVHCASSNEDMFFTYRLQLVKFSVHVDIWLAFINNVDYTYSKNRRRSILTSFFYFVKCILHLQVPRLIAHKVLREIHLVVCSQSATFTGISASWQESCSKVEVFPMLTYLSDKTKFHVSIN